MGTRESHGATCSQQEHILPVAQGVLVGLGGAIGSLGACTPSHILPSPAPGDQEAALSPDLQAALPRSPPGAHLTGLETGCG